MRDALRSGAVLACDGERVVALDDRHGHRLAELRWTGASAALIVPVAPAIGDHDTVEIAAETEPHPVLGPVHAIRRGGATLAVVSAIDWRAPRAIPAIDRPAALPRGTGAIILDMIAFAAAHAGVAPLRYLGPYPTRALWTALTACFTATGDEDAFAAGAPVSFAPAPFARHWQGARVAVDLRTTLERAAIDGRVYGRGAHRLVEEGPHHHAALWIGDAAYARVATFAADGALVDGPHAPPSLASPVIGQRFPPAMVRALAALCADTAAPALAPAITAVLEERALAWADTGLDLVRALPGAIAVHAALWDRLAPRGLARVAAALAEALSPVARALAQERLATILE
ncbi:MAG: hypothetical protein K8W52_40110 [Deltaproteobacteria bacterium]|nr:hypothetical protein [Deltaproteobacteria bacterium]